jgi:hypothetical protein
MAVAQELNESCPGRHSLYSARARCDMITFCRSGSVYVGRNTLQEDYSILMISQAAKNIGRPSDPSSASPVPRFGGPSPGETHTCQSCHHGHHGERLHREKAEEDRMSGLSPDLEYLQYLRAGHTAGEHYPTSICPIDDRRMARVLCKDTPLILFTRLLLYRSPISNCGPHCEKGVIPSVRGTGEGYQTMLTPETSQHPSTNSILRSFSGIHAFPLLFPPPTLHC